VELEPLLRVLLVEDESLISLMTSICLEDAGYHVTVAADGQHGLEIALQDRPEVIISDYMMPKMNGLEMIARLRERGFNAPVVLTTSIPESQIRSNPGYNAYLPKPYRELELLALLKRFQDEH
jgi:CheY-like chemotaxis protein